MARDMQTTTDHDAIRQWAEERGGVPAAVKNTLAGDRAGILTIDFPGSRDKDVDEMTWEEFFKIFDRENLALSYQETAPDGNLSITYDIVARESGESVEA